MLADFARLPAQTVPVILLRHAKAVAKSHWKRADDRRPLDDAGRADAKALAELLACFGPRARLITSPAARCVETLRPFAELSGAELREEPSLYIHHHSSRTDPADSPTSIAALLSEAVAAGEPTIFCAHRENIPVLQAAALAALGLAQPPSDAAPGSPLAGVGLKPFPELPKEWDDPLPTSGFWVLNLTLPPPPAPTASPPPPASPPRIVPRPPTARTPTRRPTRTRTSPPPLPAWRRWFRARTRTGAHAAPPRPRRHPAPSRHPAAPPRATPPPAAPSSPERPDASASSPAFLAAPVLAPEPEATCRRSTWQLRSWPPRPPPPPRKPPPHRHPQPPA